VFVSSTYVDLKVERQTVIETVLALDCFPAGMEFFPSSEADQMMHIRKVIDDSDYYVLIVGGRYGSTDDSGLYTPKPNTTTPNRPECPYFRFSIKIPAGFLWTTQNPLMTAAKP
jgi:hypothetical protein